MGSQGGMEECAVPPLACSPFPLLKSLMGCSVSLGLSAPFQGISALPWLQGAPHSLCCLSSSRAKIPTYSGCPLAEGKFPFPMCGRTAVSALGRFSLPFKALQVSNLLLFSAQLPVTFQGCLSQALAVNEGGALASSALPHSASVKLFDPPGSLVPQKMRSSQFGASFPAQYLLLALEAKAELL